MDFRDKIITEIPRAIKVAGKNSNFETFGGLKGLEEKFRQMKVSMPLMETLERVRATHDLIPAIPTDEEIGSVAECPVLMDEPRIVGVDGSQIYPSNQAAVQWSYVRALASHGNKILESGRFFTPEDLSDEDQGEAVKRRVDGWREVYESEIIAQAAECPEWANHIILTDGSLLPWSGMEKKMNEVSDIYRKNIQRTNGRLLAGVVSSPRSRYCMNLLRIALQSEGEKDHPIPISDTIFFRDYLKVGQRSAVYLHGSPVNDDFTASVHMFYLKVSDSEVFRVEIPSWVAHDPIKVSNIHAAIYQDSLGLEYPYSLIKAHDSVKISQEVALGLQEQADRDYYREQGVPFILPAKVRLKNAYTE